MTRIGPTRLPRLALDALASRTLSFWVMGSWIALAAVWLVPFQLTGQPDATIDGIATHWLPFRIVYGALLVTTLACGAVRLVRDVRRARRVTPLDRRLPERPALEAPGSLADAEDALRSLGFSVRAFEDRVLADRRRWSLVGGSLFHLAIPLIAAGLLLHAATAASLNFRLIEGQGTDEVLPKVTSGVGAWRSLRSAAASLTLERVRPEYFGDVLLFKRLDATLRDRSGSRQLSLASPLWLDPFTMISIQDFGIAPRMQVVDPDGRVAEDVVTDMSIFPPGNQDTAEMPRTGYVATLKLFPDYGVVAGRDVSLSYNLRDPRLLVGLERTEPAGVVIDRRLVALGQPVMDGGRSFRVKELRYYGEFRVWRSYGLPLLLFAGLLLVAGLAARLLFPRQDVVVWALPAGVGMLARVDGRIPAETRPLLERIAAAMAGGTRVTWRSRLVGPGSAEEPDTAAETEEYAYRDEEAR